MKVRLQAKKRSSWRGKSPDRITDILHCLPFITGQAGTYVHRVRYAQAYYDGSTLTHMAFECWCGQGALMSDRKKSRLYSDPPQDRYMCATCEGRAIGAGLTESRTIAGRELMFRPRSTLQGTQP